MRDGEEKTEDVPGLPEEADLARRRREKPGFGFRQETTLGGIAMHQTALILITAGLISAGDAKAKRRPTDAIAGTWIVVELVEAGKKAPEAKAKSLRLVFKADTVAITIKDKPVVKGTIAVDAGRTPATIDIRYKRDGKEYTIPGVYELKGDGLKLCHPLAEGGNRPSAIEATAGTVLMTLKRKKL